MTRRDPSDDATHTKLTGTDCRAPNRRPPLTSSLPGRDPPMWAGVLGRRRPHNTGALARRTAPGSFRIPTKHCRSSQSGPGRTRGFRSTGDCRRRRLHRLAASGVASKRLGRSPRPAPPTPGGCWSRPLTTTAADPRSVKRQGAASAAKHPRSSTSPGARNDGSTPAGASSKTPAANPAGSSPSPVARELAARTAPQAATTSTTTNQTIANNPYPLTTAPPYGRPRDRPDLGRPPGSGCSRSPTHT